MSSNRPGLVDLSGIARDRAMAEASEWLAMLDLKRPKFSAAPMQVAALG